MDACGETAQLYIYKGALKMPSKALVRHVNLGLLTAAIAIAAFPELSRGFEVSRPPQLQQHPPDVLARKTTLALENILQQGRKEADAGRFERAAALWQEAAAQYRQNGDFLQAALSSSYLSFAYLQLGQVQRARETVQESKNLLQQVADKSGAANVKAQILNTEGSIQLAAGETQAALETWQASEKTYELAGDAIGKLGATVNQAQALQAMGHYRRAKIELERVNQQLQLQPDSAVKATGLRSLGIALQVLGDVTKSEELLQQSLAIAQQIGSAPAASAALFSLGNSARAKQDLDGAAEYYQKAAAIATAPGDKLEAQIRLFSARVEKGQQPEAVALLPQIQAAIAQMPPSRTSVYARVNLAETLMKMGNGASEKISPPAPNPKGDPLPPLSPSSIPNTRETAQLLATAVQQARELNDQRAESYSLGALGKLYEKTEQWQEAKNLTEKALLIANGIEADEIAARWQSQMGEILKQQGDKTGAIAAYSEAVKTFGTLRRDLVAVNPEVQFSFRESVEPSYRELVGLLLQSQPTQENLKQAREVIEELQLAELDNFFREACLDAKPAQIDRVDPTAAVIYPIILGDRLEVILSLPGKPLQNYKVLLSREQIETTLRQSRQALSLSASKKDRLQLYATIYDWLVRPAEAEIAASGVKTLVFVQDGYFRNLPMSALYDGEQYLIEKYSIALTPGLQLLAPRSLSGGELKTLMGGLSESRQGFAALPGVKTEIERVASEVTSKVLLDGDFTENSIRSALSQTSSPVIHLATHGQFSSNAEETYILTWDGKIKVSEFGNLLGGRNENRFGAIELLVLSACQTAKGDERAALGLAGLAVKSGARSTIATLWSVKDQSTADVMAEFYKQLSEPGTSKAEALRQAQLSLLKQPQFGDPFYWAPFVLVGNWL